MDNLSVAGCQQQHMFSGERLDDLLVLQPMACLRNLLDVVSTPRLSQKNNHDYNKHSQSCVFHEVLLPVTTVTAHVLFKCKLHICIKPT